MIYMASPKNYAKENCFKQVERWRKKNQMVNIILKKKCFFDPQRLTWGPKWPEKGTQLGILLQVSNKLTDKCTDWWSKHVL